jgi:uncharacterized phage protein (TIGR01671 family)
MREIKFRAWDGKAFYVPYTDGHGYFYHGNAAIDMGEITKDPVMQYTGLNDKNGTDVYEGDLIKLLGLEQGTKEGIEFDLKYIYKVTWSEAELAWQLVLVNAEGSYIREGLGRLNLSELFRPDLKWEVIGSIYENKELLK